jgi:hypothetical protein
MGKALVMTDSTSQSLVERLDDARRDEKSVSTYARLCREAAARITGLEATVARLTANPADHRYWEGRYRDEKLRALAAESELSRVEGETIERCAVVAEEYRRGDPETVRMISYRVDIAEAIRSLPPLAKRGEQKVTPLTKPESTQNI